MSNAVAGKLIQIIKTYPVLYDPSNADYRSKEVVEPLWQEIALDLNENDMELRKRWRNLRDTYVRLLRLIKNSENDEVFKAAATRKYHRWVWSRDMEFFRPYLTIGNKLGELDLGLQGVERTIDEETSKKKPASKSKKLKEMSPSPSTASSARRFLPNTREVQSTTTMRLRNAQKPQSISSVSNQTELDATDRLFLAHSQNIKQFSARRQAITKLKIAEVIMEQEILDQEEKDLSSSSIISSKSAKKRKYKQIRSADDDSILPFETVCGYETDEADADEIPYNATNFKRETYEEDPVDDDDF